MRPRNAATFNSAPGATPLDRNEIDGLLADYISTQGELNQLEQENILEAKVWATGRKHKHVLTDTFVRNLHQRMLGNVWRWAGKYRLTDKSIGVPWQQVPTDIARLLADTIFWVRDSIFGWDELATRFHHRLASIHAFPNGNGRHARLMTDVLLQAHSQPPFSWGAGLAHSNDSGETQDLDMIRTEYIAALREADERKLERLILFVRS